MRHAIPVPVARELGVLDQNIASRYVALENAVLVVVEVAVTHGPIHSLRANAGAVFGSGRGAGELNVLDQEVAPGGHPDSFVLRTFLIGIDVRAPVHALNR